MSIASTIGFLSAHLSSNDCELFAEGGKIIAYVPTKADYEARIEMDEPAFTAAELTAREWGLRPTWN